MAGRALSWVGSVLSIICLAAGAAVTYGIVNDQFLAHLSVQYFTIGHVDYLRNGHPEVLAFEWGFLGTWWVGLSLGIPVALVANVGRAPRLGARDFVGPVLLLVSLMAVAAAIAWIAAYTLASSGTAFIANVVRPGVSPGQRFTYYADFWANIAGYIVGPLGALALLAWTGWRRISLGRSPGRGRDPRPWQGRVLSVLVPIGAIVIVLAAVLIAAHRMPVFN